MFKIILQSLKSRFSKGKSIGHTVFLTAMSSSRSDDVTKCVRLSVVILFSLEHSKHWKQGDLRKEVTGKNAKHIHGVS